MGAIVPRFDRGDGRGPSGAVVVQATVVARETKTGIEHRTFSNTTGEYLFADLLPGTYRIAISAPGFKQTISENIVLTAQAVQRFDVTLQVGTPSDSVVVQATAPTLNTENGNVAGLVTRDEMQNLPVNSRSTFNFLYLNSYNVGAIGSGNSLGVFEARTPTSPWTESPQTTTSMAANRETSLRCGSRVSQT